MADRELLDEIEKTVKKALEPLEKKLSEIQAMLEAVKNTGAVSPPAEDKVLEHKGVLWKIAPDGKTVETEPYCPNCYHKNGQFVTFSTPDPFYEPTCSRCANSAPFKAHHLEQARLEAKARLKT